MDLTYWRKVYEFRGDGCLAVFNSAVAAMHAAKAIQESLRKAFENGRNYSINSYDFEYAFRPLRDYQPFVEKFMKPKG